MLAWSASCPRGASRVPQDVLQLHASPLSEAALPYDPEDLIEAWLLQSDAHLEAHNVERFARYAPELGWQSILAVLELPDAQAHVDSLSHALLMLIAQYGFDFIDRIEHEAAVSTAFKSCLAEVHPDTVFRIPEALWSRLSAAAGASVGPMAPHMAKLYDEIPGIGEVQYWDPNPMRAQDIPQLGRSELRAQAEAWLTYTQNFWAYEELNRVREEERLDAAWPFVLALVARGSDHAIGAAGAGLLEDMLEEDPHAMIERVEEQATADQRFRYCLSHVWQGDIPEDVWSRIVVARGDEPQRG
jgi:uncharacterized protein DUF6869